MGKTSVQYETQQGSAASVSGARVSFGFQQALNTRLAQSFHSFSAYGKEYLLLASSSRKGQAGPSAPGVVSVQDPLESTLFRWQGVFVPLMVSMVDSFTLSLLFCLCALQ